MLMPKTKSKKQKLRAKAATMSSSTFEGVYLFKMVLYLLLGSLWLKVGQAEGMSVPIPIGLIIGLIFASHEHFQLDRKLEYAVLLAAMLFGYFAPYGVYVRF